MYAVLSTISQSNVEVVLTNTFTASVLTFDQSGQNKTILPQRKPKPECMSFLVSGCHTSCTTSSLYLLFHWKKNRSLSKIGASMVIYVNR